MRLLVFDPVCVTQFKDWCVTKSLFVTTAIAVSLVVFSNGLQSPANAETPEQTAAKTEDRRICRKETKTGSRLGVKRVCKTQSEWEAESASGGRALQDQRLRSGR
jgi:hypothetical protein